MSVETSLDVACWVDIDCRRPSGEEVRTLDTCDYCFADRSLDDHDDGEIEADD